MRWQIRTNASTSNQEVIKRVEIQGHYLNIESIHFNKDREIDYVIYRPSHI
jgi:hypothetical protein